MVLKIPIGAKGIYLGPSRSELVIFSGGDIVYIDHGITNPIKRLLTLLNGGYFRSKEFLINEIWHYDYDPEIHDSLLYATIGKARKILGDFSGWIEWSIEGYRLNPHIQMFFPASSEDDQFNTKLSSVSEPEKNSYRDLNIRQMKTLKSLQFDEFLTARGYAKRHRICTMTACRDLTFLHKQGLLVKIGKGRSTVYGRPDAVL